MYENNIQSYKVNVSYITPDNLTATIMEKLNETAAESNAVLRERSEDEAENIMKEMMQRCVAIGQESHLDNLKILSQIVSQFIYQCLLYAAYHMHV